MVSYSQVDASDVETETKRISGMEMLADTRFDNSVKVNALIAARLKWKLNDLILLRVQTESDQHLRRNTQFALI